MPLYKRKAFLTGPTPKDLRPEEEIFYLKLTNEIFRDYDEYFQRVILCNSLVWACSLTGKINLTYEEALDSEKQARKLLNGFPRSLKTALLFLTNQTQRGKVLDVCEDLFSYAREHYFVGEEVYGVIGNMWCRSRVVHIIPPTEKDIELYKAEQMEKGELEKNDYLKDDSWGPPPDLFRYEVEETDPDNPAAKEVHVLESIDVKRSKTMITRDKCKVFIKLCTYYSDKDRAWRVKDDIWKTCSLDSVQFTDIFVGRCPTFESSLGPVSSSSSKRSASGSGSRTATSKAESKSEGEAKVKKKRNRSKSTTNSPSESAKNNRSKNTENQEGKSSKKKRVPKSKSEVDGSKKKRGESKPNKQKDEKELTPQEIKQIEYEKKVKDREMAKEQKKLVVDFKKLWFKPKEDLEVEDLKDIPAPDPISCKIPNHLFGDFMMIIEYFSCYSSLLKVRDCFPNGLGFDMMERALVKSEIAGPLSDILQLLLRAIFRLQESEDAEIAQDEKAAVELQIDETVEDVSAAEAIQQATAAATWSLMYQNTSLHKLTLDHLCLTEVLRLHLLVSGARVSEKDVKWRYQMRGGYTSHDDPGLQLRLEEPQILKTLSQGTVFDLTVTEKIKLIQCLINQIMTYVSVRDTVEESFEQFKQARYSLRSLQAAEKRKEAEDHIWRQKLKADRAVPDPNFMKTAAVQASVEDESGLDKKIVSDEKTSCETIQKPQLTDEQIETQLLKRDKETAKRKQQFEWKAAEYTDIVNKHERKLGVHPIGRDRAYRRYWIFTSLPGLFVEHDDDTVGSCLPTPTPYISEVNLEDMTFIKDNFEKLKQQKQEGSDKENSSGGVPKKVVKKKSISTPSKQDKESRPEVFGICTGDKDSCPVHCSYLPRPKWYFYWNVEQLDALIAGLTTRGLREKELRNVLLEEKSGIANLIQKCPVLKLNTEKKYPEAVAQAADRKSQRVNQGTSKHSLDPNLNFPAGTSIETILELQLRDLILETEDKIFLGALGSLKIDERSVWRKAIESRSYDKQTSDLRWGESKTLSSSTKTSGSTTPVEAGPSSRANKSKDEDEMSSEGSSSRSSNSKDEIICNPVIRDLGSAILQLEQSLEPKFLKRPLGIDKEDPDKKKRSSGKSGDNDSNIIKAKWLLGSARERWETSLMKSTSFPQLFMHLFTLDNSIEWTRSVLNARCRLCRRKGDAENMLLCDGCNKGHHVYCLKPALEVIPKGEWFCLDCKPPELLPRTARNGRKVFPSEEEFEEGSASGEENYGSENNSEDDDDDGPPVLRAVDSLEIEVCEVCESGGEVICCDGCPRVYHLECLNPPKTRVPRGSWYCDECSKPKKKGRKVTKPKLKKVLPQKKKYSNRTSSESEEDDEEEDDEEIVGEEEEETGEEGSDQERESSREDDEDDDEAKVQKPKLAVKVKFTKSPKKQGYGTRSNSSGLGKNYAENGSNDSEDEEEEGRGTKRRSASQAAIKIAQVSKRLRSDSKENESSENSNDSNSNSNSSSSNVSGRKRSLDSDGGYDGPKRTRLQRMNTNRCGDSGDLDNVLLDRLLVDLMKHGDAWPFLKPVTRAEAPDYHDIVKTPMDLGTIKYKLNSMVYTCNQELLADLHLVFDNCFNYNSPNTNIYKAGDDLKTYCERRCSKSGIQFSEPAHHD